MGVYSALLLPMPWCWSTRPSVSTLLMKYSFCWTSFIPKYYIYGQQHLKMKLHFNKDIKWPGCSRVNKICVYQSFWLFSTIPYTVNFCKFIWYSIPNYNIIYFSYSLVSPKLKITEVQQRPWDMTHAFQHVITFNIRLRFSFQYISHPNIPRDWRDPVKNWSAILLVLSFLWCLAGRGLCLCDKGYYYHECSKLELSDSPWSLSVIELSIEISPGRHQNNTIITVSMQKQEHLGRIVLFHNYIFPSGERNADTFWYNFRKITMVKSLWLSDAIRWHKYRSGSTLAQVMACCLMAPSHYMNQCWLLISEVFLHSPDCSFRSSGQATFLYNVFKNYTFKFTATSHRGQWFNVKNQYIYHSTALSVIVLCAKCCYLIIIVTLCLDFFISYVIYNVLYKVFVKL